MRKEQQKRLTALVKKCKKEPLTNEECIEYDALFKMHSDERIAQWVNFNNRNNNESRTVQAI